MDKSNETEMGANNNYDLQLECSDKIIFTVNHDVIKCSKTISNMLVSLRLNKSEIESQIVCVPLNKISSTVLEKVLQWAEHYKNASKFDEDRFEAKELKLSEWDMYFLKENDEYLLDIMLAAKFLNIQLLLDMTCQTVAARIKGRTAVRFNNVFNPSNEVDDNNSCEKLPSD